MSYIGSTPVSQNFIAGTDYFNGTGAQVAFTLSRAVNSVNDIEVIVNNVEQIPSGYTVSGTTLTFSVAPSAGTDNVYVRYLSTTLQSITVPAGTTVGGNFGVAGNLTVTANTTTDAVRITQTGTGNALVVEDNTSPDSTPLVVNNIGQLVVGHTAAIGAGQNTNIQSQATGGLAGVSAFRWSNDTIPPRFQVGKSRGAAVGTNAIVQSGDQLGGVYFYGDDGTDLVSQGASIIAEVDGTPGTNDMPGRLVFSTTADGAATPTERMRIRSDGAVVVGASSGATVNLKAGVTGTTGALNWTFNSDSTVYGSLSLPYDTRGTVGLKLESAASYPITVNTGNGVIFQEDGTETMRITSAGNVGIGTTSPATALDVNGTVTATAFVGNGSGLTGISAGLPGTQGQVFTSTGTFTVPTGVTAVKVTVIGGGGNGATVTGTGAAGGGGGGAGTSIKYVTGLTPGGTVAVTVGGVAGTSSFGAFCSATGGATAATVTVSSGQGAGGAGGAGSGGDINIAGGAGKTASLGMSSGAGGSTNFGVGQNGIVCLVPIGCGGTAYVLTSYGSQAVGFFGTGGLPTAGPSINAVGNAATGFGNGGSGGIASGVTTDRAGGAGKAGIVIVEW